MEQYRTRLIEAVLVAHDSPDDSTQNGAVLYRGDQRMAASTNYVPIPMKPEYQARPLKYSYFVHAEEGVIAKSAKHGSPTNNTTMYCPFACCDRCARNLIVAGVKTLVRWKPMMDAAPERWMPQIRIGDQMLRDAHITIVEYEDPLDAGVTLRFDGKPWRV